MFGKVGAGGLQAIKDRQLQRGQDLTPELLASLEVVQAVLASKPMRRYDLWWNEAAEDETNKGSGGFHLVFLDATQDRQSFVAVVDDSLYNLCQEGDHHISSVGARNDPLRAFGETGPVSWLAGGMICRQHSSVDVAH